MNVNHGQESPPSGCQLSDRRVSDRDMLSSVEHVRIMASVHHVSARETSRCQLALTWRSILFKSRGLDTFLSIGLASGDDFTASL